MAPAKFGARWPFPWPSPSTSCAVRCAPCWTSAAAKGPGSTICGASGPKISYIGLDPSDYAVERFGASRNIRQAAFADLPSLHFDRRFDLIVCSDVLHYVAEKDIRSGIAEIVRVLGGVVFIEVLTREDEIIGDLQGLTRRPAEWYRRLFNEAGLVQVGPYSWLTPSLHPFAAELELP